MLKKSFLSNVLILMASAFIVKIFGFAYRIFLSNVIGAEGMGLFQLVMPIYSLIILTLTSGISVAVSKMAAEEIAKKHLINVRRITMYGLFIVVCVSCFVSFLLYLSANSIATFLLKDSRTYYSILLLVPCIPVVAASSAIKGYFYATSNMMPTAISQIVEQCVKLGILVFLAGTISTLKLEYACAIITLAMALGEIANLLFLIIPYCAQRKSTNKSNFGYMKRRTLLKSLTLTAAPVSANRLIISLMSAIELILIPRMLLSTGLDYSACMTEFGKLTGMAMPLIMFPAVITSSLAIILVPSVSEAMSLGNLQAVKRRIKKSIYFTVAMGFFFTAAFLFFPNQIGNFVYKSYKTGDMIFLLGFTCVFVYLQQTLIGILNGLGKQAELLKNSILGYVIRIGFVCFCVPLYGIPGYIAGMAVSSACICFFNMRAVSSKENF